ncbi:N-formylglutamate amidohydrolase [Sphingomonas sp. EC-HK361]|uniref:N-formylglutamate amidohydrolase n=1 Tax=Sphingomonas sp. EC-HK361 TaxID=2038397 RepID=UPI0018FE7989
MATVSMRTPSFDLHGPCQPESPVVLSVPHAGRDYPMALRAAIRVPLEALAPLEDRHVDALAHAARGDHTTIVQRLPRAWIDLNRAEHERDPAIDSGADRRRQSAPSLKLRSGLGLVPRRTPGAGDIWRGKLSSDEVVARIECDHRPYHAALGDLLDAARARFGIAILLDIHSMPPLASGARIVLGDRFGKSAGARFVYRLEAEARAHRIPCALNTPYAGGHILERHARTQDNIHAVQLEIDRTLYLDPRMDGPGPGFAGTAALLARMIAALADEAEGTPFATAAE